MADNFNGSVYLNDPNVRYAVSFLSNKYRNNSVRGELMMDKATGEIFTRRTTDGRVVSFLQMHKDINDLLFDLRVMSSANTTFTYPSSTSIPDSCYVSMDFDLMRLNNNEEKDLTTENITTNDDQSVHMIYFRISTSSNGFCSKIMPRDTDRPIISWATATYNALCRRYTGEDPLYVAEHNKFEISGWDESDAEMKYDVVLNKEDGTTDVYEFTSYIAMGANDTIVFPENLPVSEVFQSESAYIRIKSIDFTKLHFVMDHLNELTDEYKEAYHKVKPADERIYIRYATMNYFADNANQIIMTGNNFITAMVACSTIDVYLARMQSISADVPIILSPVRPAEGLWSTNAIWFEQARDVSQGNEEVVYDTETSFNQLEEFLAGNPDDNFLSAVEIRKENAMYL